MKLGQFVTMILVFLAASQAQAGEGVSFDRTKDGQIRVLVDGEKFADYVYRDEKTPRPYFAGVRVPRSDGVALTRNHPPIEGVDLTDHPTFHPGVWMAFGDLSGHDSWRCKAQVRHDRFVKEPWSDPKTKSGGFIGSYSHLTQDGSKVVAVEQLTIHVKVHSSGVLLIWDSLFQPGPDGLACVFGDQEEMGLGIRVATPIAVKAGGQIRDSKGRVNEKQVWGQQANWCDYGAVFSSANSQKQRAGLVIMTDPNNFRSSWFHARDYGVLVANPFGQAAFTKGPKSRVEVRPGQPLRLRYGIFAYSRPNPEPLDAAAVYRWFLDEIAR